MGIVDNKIESRKNKEVVERHEEAGTETQCRMKGLKSSYGGACPMKEFRKAWTSGVRGDSEGSRGYQNTNAKQQD